MNGNTPPSRHIQIIAIAISIAAFFRPASGDVIYESGIVLNEATVGAGPEYAVGSAMGSPFSIANPVMVTNIGGNIWGLGGIVFVLLVETDAAGNPPLFPFESENILALGTATTAETSADLMVPVSVALDPGDYAIIVGIGNYGATEDRAAGNPFIDPDSASTLISFNGTGWSPILASSGHRYFVDGYAVPEPTVMMQITIGLACLILLKGIRGRLRAT